MPTPKLGYEHAKQAVDEVNTVLADGFRLDGGGRSAVREAAKRLNLTSGTMYTRLRRAKELYQLEPDYTLQEAVVESSRTDGKNRTAFELDKLEESYRAIREVHRLRAANKTLTAQLREAIKRQQDSDDIKQVAFGINDLNPDPPDWVVAKPSLGGKHYKQEMPILFTSDFQWGERVEPSEVDYLNEYNAEVARDRYRKLIEKTINICHHHHAHPKYPGIIYLRGGDALSGDIHDELLETNELSPHPAIKDLAEIEIWGIETLQQHFGNVLVYSVPGNHGRTTKKPRAKGYADLNYEDLLSWFLEKYFSAKKGGGAVTFITPRTGDAYFKVFDVNFLLTHGDRIGARGGQGFIGPAAVILKGIHKTRQQYHQVGKHIDYVLMGHFHEPMFLPHGMVNGSLIGFNEYARGLRIEPHSACQWLFFVHPDHGIVEKRLIYVDR